MLDAKSILEGLVRGAAPQAQQGGGGLADILGQVLGGGGGAQRGAPAGGGGGLGDILGELGRQFGGGGAGQGSAPSGGGQGGGGLGDILGELQRQMGQAGSAGQRHAAPQADQGGGLGGGLGGGMGDILGQLKDKLGQAGGAGGGGLADILGQVLGQATQGAREGATRIGEATGAGEALGRATGGQSADELLGRLKDLVAQNPMVAGGLGGLVLGTKTGRSAAVQAAKIGALALIGGLAYKAFQNYQSGRPLISGATPPEVAPHGSGFEPAAITNDQAAHYIQAMIAAAAADGRIDAAEQAKILGGLKQAGVDAEAEAFLAQELNNPKTVDDLASAVATPEEAIQLYTAARIAIEPDTRGEQAFLAQLAAALGIDDKLAAHIDAQTRSATA